MSHDGTPRLGLPMLAAGQAQKEMTHNEALLLLDALVSGMATAIGAESPPDRPEDGQCWIVGADPTGAWQGHANALAAWSAGGWRFLAPREGMRVWAGAETGFALFRDGDWRIGEVHGKVFVEGVQVVGRRGLAVAEPAGGIVVDGQARAAIVAVLEALRTHGLIASDQL
ncbi:DUF2793 domain-containing protein [Sphingomonas xinjiangensis]|uniref:DUF2793 domain-containing protein n=1 Tax=Sphingomonas xinjiangensis TaxID=643568 RepID=A0A840YDH3_9SPHN|nr:DUF2793 domain-containing protein [Sphingomonas xinjiangensis]MBB5711447.1 hypothetical protein [Sphingomonas xinjiangensis]